MHQWSSPDPVALHARARPQRIACVDLASGRRWTYAAFDDCIQRAMAVLADQHGVRTGDRVAAAARNSGALLILNLALMRLGAIFVPVNWRLAPAEQQRILADCTPVLLLTDAAAAAVPGFTGAVLAVADFAAAIELASPAPRRALPPADAASILLYTSGTSGNPKGVVISERNAFATAVNFGVLGRVAHDSVFLCDAPMFHVIGLIASLRAPLLQGGAVLISSGFDPQATNDRLADRTLGVTHYFCVPEMAEMLRRQPNFRPAGWTTLTALFTGGAPNPPANIGWWLQQGVKMVDGYGMTEAGTISGMPVEADLIAAKAGSVGLPAPWLTLRLVDDRGNDVAAGEAAEIWVAGPSVAAGYWNRPQETAAAFTADGWLRTGDIARRDSDGFLTVVDRRKDMFISGGENVYPAEVEIALLQHPAVGEVAVVGVNDDRWGEVGRAFVVLASSSAAHPDELAAHCVSLLARYKCPKAFVFVDSLPRTGSGKIIKHMLRAHCQDAN